MPKHLIFFGAGASHGSDLNTTAKPPLGNNLFANLQESELTYYWKKIQKKHANHFNKENGFEAAMAKLSANKYDRLTNLQDELALFFSSYIISENSTYYSIAKKIKNTINWDGALATLNYDNLLDQALVKENILPYTNDNIDITAPTLKDIANRVVYFIADDECISKLIIYDKSKDYLSISNPSIFRFDNIIEVCYPHGGCQFCVPVASAFKDKTGSTFIGDLTNWPAVHLISVSQDVHMKILEPSIDKFYWIPVIAQYSPSKKAVSANNHIENQKVRFAELVLSAERITICGVRYNTHDFHIWDPIFASKAEIMIIDPSWLGPNKKNIWHIAKYFAESLCDLYSFNHLD